MSNKHLGFTLVELLVCLGIITVLCAILFPVFQNSKKKSISASCSTHMRQVGQTILMYASDYDDTFPNRPAWHRWSLIHKNSVPLCPTIKVTDDTKIGFEGVQGRFYKAVPGYALNSDLLSFQTTAHVHKPNEVRECKTSDVSYPTTTVLLCEQSADTEVAMGPDPYANATPYPFGIRKEWERHLGGANYVFCDGHVKWYRPEAVSPANYPLGPGNKNLGNDGINPSFMKLSTEDIIPIDDL